MVATPLLLSIAGVLRIKAVYWPHNYSINCVHVRDFKQCNLNIHQYLLLLVCTMYITCLLLQIFFLCFTTFKFNHLHPGWYYVCRNLSLRGSVCYVPLYDQDWKLKNLRVQV